MNFLDRTQTDAKDRRLQDLQTLHHITETLNRSLNVKDALEASLDHLLELMGLETGWIFLLDGSATERWWGRGYRLAAHRNLPPALALDNPEAWDGGCDCQGFCTKGKLTENGERRLFSVKAGPEKVDRERRIGRLSARNRWRY